jgi:hypothetical protein
LPRSPDRGGGRHPTHVRAASEYRAAAEEADARHNLGRDAIQCSSGGPERNRDGDEERRPERDQDEDAGI